MINLANEQEEHRKRNESEQPIKKMKMVEWYSPRQLIKTGINALISTIFGKHADYRLIEAFDSNAKHYYDYSCEYLRDSRGHYKTENGFYIPDKRESRQEIWIDYVSDLGDGWNSTYTVAYYLAKSRLLLRTIKGKQWDTTRGDILIFGGDEVYPAASRTEYNQRLVQPYEAALPRTNEPQPHLFAIPGNHDWYDSLVSFTRLFCSRSQFAGWQAPQACSYFALKLPHGWWLLGTDIQLGTDIDSEQVKYFENVAAMMNENDKVILCNATPYWVTNRKYGIINDDFLEYNLNFLEKKILKQKVHVFLAGDYHHYRRFEYIPKRQDGSPDHSKKVEKITSGGGGAFLHPTHDITFNQIIDSTEQGQTQENRVFNLAENSYPDVKTSRKLTKKNLIFLYKNKSFGWLTGLIYVITAWCVMAPLYQFQISQIGDAVNSALLFTMASPAAGLSVLFVMLAMYLFAGFSHYKDYQIIAGMVHGFTQLAAIFFVSWGAAYLCVVKWGYHFYTVPQLVLTGCLIFIGGWIAGSTILGIYLFISLNYFGRHSNEAFSSLRIEDWKNFLRLHIDREGNLTIFPVGIKRIERNWIRKHLHMKGSKFIPNPKRRTGTEPHLIEEPIIIKRR